MRVLKTIGLAFAAAAVSALFASGAFAATTAEVLAAVAKAHANTDTYEADVRATLGTGDEKVESVGHVVTQRLFKDGKLVGRLMNMRQTLRLKTAAVIQLAVNDGEFLWSETKNSMTSAVTVVKQKAQESTADALDNMESPYELKLVGEDTFDGQKMWVLAGDRKKGTDTGSDPKIGKARLYFGQQDFLCHRMIGYDQDGKQFADTQFTNIRVNGKVDPMLFKYTPPLGARVVDLTQGGPDVPYPDALKEQPARPAPKKDDAK